LPEADVEVASDAAGSIGYGAYLKAFGLLVPGLLFNNSSPLLIRSSFQLSSLLMFGDTCGARSTSFSVQTTMLSSMF